MSVSSSTSLVFAASLAGFACITVSLAKAESAKSIEKVCDDYTDNMADLIFSARDEKLPLSSVLNDEEVARYGTERELDMIARYMADSASKAKTMTNGQLRALGFAYCIQRLN